MENQNKPKKVSIKKVCEATGLKIKPLFVKATIEPDWGGWCYKITISLNLLGKIVSSLTFPVDLFLNGIGEAWDDLASYWKTGEPISYHFEKGDTAVSLTRFEAVKKLYEEN